MTQSPFARDFVNDARPKMVSSSSASAVQAIHLVPARLKLPRAISLVEDDIARADHNHAPAAYCRNRIVHQLGDCREVGVGAASGGNMGGAAASGRLRRQNWSLRCLRAVAYGRCALHSRASIRLPVQARQRPTAMPFAQMLTEHKAGYLFY